MTTIRIEDNTTFNEIEFETRVSIMSEQVQDFIQEARENNIDIRCMCKIQNNEYPKIISQHFPNDDGRFTLKRNSRYEHAEDCIFYSERKNFYDDTNEKYKSAIFEEPKIPEGTENINYDSTKEKVRRYTYSHFCLDLLAESSSFAFNMRNQSQEDTSEAKSPSMYTQEEYFKALSIKIANKKMANGKKALKSLPANHKLSFGTIDDLNVDINGMIQLKEYNTWDKEYENIEAKITDRRLVITQNRQKNHGNILGGPYIYIAVYKKESGQQKEIVRLYTYAIESFENKFSFVDSGLERRYARYLLENNIAFIKPINGNEHETLNKKYYIDEKIPKLKFKADFIEYKNNFVKVVEVCGYCDDEEYMRHLENKEKYYDTLVREGKIEYLRWEG